MNDEKYLERVAKWRSNRLSDADEIAMLMSQQFPDRYQIRGLDYGCNDGVIQARMNQGCRRLMVEGVDANEAAVNKARKLGRVVSLVRNGYPTDHKDSSFDFVMSLATLAHIKQARDAVREMCRLVRPGGLLIIETPHPAYDQVVAPMHWFTGYKGDPTIVRKWWPKELHMMIPVQRFDRESVDLVGRRLPWPFSNLPLTSDYRAIYRRHL